jgi:pimeloyl-ACP methyl ester carboxylesterase
LGNPAVSTTYVLARTPYAAIDGVLRRAGGKSSRCVVIQTHPRRDSVQNLAAWPMEALPALGIDTFAFNNRFANSAAGIDVATLWEPMALDVAAAVGEMRARGYERVILYGASAGGPLMAFYQAVAIHGNAVFDSSVALSEYRGYVDRSGNEVRLPPADGIVMQNATSGPASSFLMRLDASIVDEDEAIRDPALDMFAPANGFDPESGTGRYTTEFLRAYCEAQSRRMNRLVGAARARLARLRTCGQPYLDDRFMVIPGVRALPAFVDLRFNHTTREPWPSTAGARRIIESDRPVVPNAGTDNRRRMPGTTVHTLTSFLSYRAILSDPLQYNPSAARAAESGELQWSSNTSTARHVSQIDVPLLVTIGTRDIEVHLPVGELIHAASASRDKSLVVVDGADHGMRGPGNDDAAGDAVRKMHQEAVATWVLERFAA